MKVMLKMPLTLSEAALAMGATVESDAVIDFITTDSREMSDGGLFFAIDGGEAYTNEALSCGFAVSSQNPNALFVPDTRKALLKLASHYKNKLPKLKKTVAVTGSVGKTTVKDFTAAVLETKYKVHKSTGNFNNDIGLPLSIFSAPCDTEILVLEMGMNAPFEVESLSLTAKPDIALITNIGSAHIGRLGSRENIALAKLEIISGLSKNGSLIIPSDEPLLSHIKNAFRVGEGGDVSLEDIGESSSGIFFRIKTPFGKSSEIHYPEGGIHFAYDLTLAAAAALCLEFDLNDINEAFSDISRFITRQKYIKINNILLYDDSYNASFESYAADFKMLTSRFGCASAVIGDILELGDSEEEVHKKLGALAYDFGLSKIYPFGKNALLVKEGALNSGMPKECIFENEDCRDHRKTARLILENESSGAVILIKGSRGVQTEKIIEAVKALSKECGD